MSSRPSGRARGVLLVLGALCSTALIALLHVLRLQFPLLGGLSRLEILVPLVAVIVARVVRSKMDSYSLPASVTPDPALTTIAQHETSRTDVWVVLEKRITGSTKDDTLILLPDHLDEKELFAVFAHELVHLRTGDALWQLPALVVVAPILQMLLFTTQGLAGLAGGALVVLLLPILLSWTLELSADVQAARWGMRENHFTKPVYLALREVYSSGSLTHPPKKLRILAVRLA